MKYESLVNVLITARGGSKRLPGKNIKEICGKPLIAWTIEAAKKSNYVDKIFVSTDSNLIANVSLNYGALVPRLRSPKLATDDAKSIDVVFDFEEYFSTNTKEEILLLQPTSPLRDFSHIDEMMKLVREKNFLQCYSVRDISKILKLANLGDHKNNFIPNGAMYYTKLEILRNEKTFFSNYAEKYQMSDFHSIDIDDFNDWKIAEACLKIN